MLHGQTKSWYHLGGSKDLEYQLVGRINVNKILHDNPTKRVVYCIIWYFNIDGDIFHTLRMSRLIVGECVMEMFTSGKILYFGIWRFQI